MKTGNTAPTDQMVLIGDEATPHTCWEDALSQVVATTGADRAELWFRAGEGVGQIIYDGWRKDVPRPLAIVLNRLQFQAARSRGDLEDLQIHFTHRTAVPPAARWINPPETAMSTTLLPAKAKPETTGPKREIYVVVTDVCWKGKTVKPGQQIEFAAKGSHSNRDRWLKEKRIRALTAKEAAGLQPVSPKLGEGDALRSPLALKVRKVTRTALDGFGEKIECHKLSEMLKGNKLPTVRAFDFEGAQYVAVSGSSKGGDHGYIDVHACLLLRPGQILASSVPKERTSAAGRMFYYGRHVLIKRTAYALGPEALQLCRSDCFCLDCEGAIKDAKDAEDGAEPGEPAAKVAQPKGELTLREVADSMPLPTSGRFMFIPPHKIDRSPWNPRKDFESDAAKEDLAGLAQSIREQGIIEPLIVRPSTLAGYYELVAGERRLRAATLADLEEVPCIVRPLDKIQAVRLQAVENLQRRDLNAIEEAEGYQLLMREGNYTVKDICRETGKSEATVYKSLKLLEAPPGIIVAVRENRVSASTADLIARLPVEHRFAAMDVVLHSETKGEEASGALSFRQAKEAFRVLDENARKDADWKKVAAGHHLAKVAAKVLTVAESNALLFGGGYLTVDAQREYVKPGDTCYADPQKRTFAQLAEQSGKALPAPILARECAEGKAIVLYPKEATLAVFKGELPDPKEFERRQEEAKAADLENRREAAERLKKLNDESLAREEMQREQLGRMFGVCAARTWDAATDEAFLRSLLILQICTREDEFYTALEKRKLFDGNDEDDWENEKIVSFVRDLSLGEVRGWFLELTVAAGTVYDRDGLVIEAVTQLADALLPSQRIGNVGKTADACGSTKTTR